MKQEMKFTWENNLNLVFLEFDENLTKNFVNYANQCWKDEAVKPLFDKLFDAGGTIVIVNSDIDSIECIAPEDKAKIKVDDNSLKNILGSLKEKKGKVVGCQAENLLFISQKCFEGSVLKEKLFFAAVTHELVHRIDGLISHSDNSTFCDKLSSEEIEKLKEYKENVFKIIDTKKQEPPYKTFCKEDSDDHEMLPYCVEAYAISLLCYSDDFKKSIASQVKEMTNCAINCATRK